MTIMLVLTNIVTLPVDVFTVKLFAWTIVLVLLNRVILKLAVALALYLVMIMMPVLLMNVIRILDVLTPPFLVMIITHAPPILATPLLDVYIRYMNVITKMLVTLSHVIPHLVVITTP
jgi:hypothetical protein